MPATPASPSLSRITVPAGTRGLGAIAAIGAIGGLLTLLGCGPAAGPPAFTPPPTAVEVATVDSGVLRETFTSLGTVEAAEQVRVSSELDAVVESLPFTEGVAVRKGQILATLRDSDLLAQVQRAKALADEARATFERLSRLSAEDLLSRQEQDSAAARLAVTQADHELAQVRLGKTRIAAPFAGLVSRRLVSPGTFLRVGDPVVELAQIETVKVAFSAPERLLGTLALESPVTVASVVFPGRSFVGRISVVDPILDAGTRSARLVAEVPNADGALKPGMSAEVTAVLAERPVTLTVPEEAVFAEGERNFVYAVTPDSHVEKRPVFLGVRQAGRVEVVSGLAAGETLVRAGHQKLFPGALVTPTSSAEAGNAALAPVAPESGTPAP